jgi:hypothetical protein
MEIPGRKFDSPIQTLSHGFEFFFSPGVFLCSGFLLSELRVALCKRDD